MRSPQALSIGKMGPWESRDFKTAKKAYSKVSLSSQLSSWKKQTSELMKTGVGWISPRSANCSYNLLGRHRCPLLVGPEGGEGTSVCCSISKGGCGGLA